MNFHEKSAWACLISIGLVFVPYFALVFQYPLAFVGLLVLAVIVQVILLVAFHIVNSIATASIRKSGEVPPRDEMDRWIELRAAKLSGIVLGAAVLTWCLAAAYGLPALAIGDVAAAVADGAKDPGSLPISVSMPDILLAVHALFAGFVVANLVYYGTIVFAYRRLGA